MTDGERLYVDISSIQAMSFGDLKFWTLIFDDYSGWCWSSFWIQPWNQGMVIDLMNELKMWNSWDLMMMVKTLHWKTMYAAKFEHQVWVYRPTDASEKQKFGTQVSDSLRKDSSYG